MSVSQLLSANQYELFCKKIISDEISIDKVSIDGVDSQNKLVIKDQDNNIIFRVDTVNDITSVSDTLQTLKIKVDGTVYTLPLTDGSPNQVLSTDGFGNLTFQSNQVGTSASSLQTTGLPVNVLSAPPLGDNYILRTISATSAEWVQDPVNDILRQTFANSYSLIQLTDAVPYYSQQTIAYDSQEAIAIAADGKVPAENTTDPGFGGWEYTKDVGDLQPKINWYFIGSLPYTLDQISQLAFTMKLFTNINQQSVPFFSIYTQPEGPGDAGGWYRSRITYAIQPLDRLTMFNPTNTVLCYVGLDPANIDPALPHFEMLIDPAFSVGPQQPDEKVLAISFSSDSSVLAGNCSFAINQFISSIGGESIQRTLT